MELVNLFGVSYLDFGLLLVISLLVLLKKWSNAKKRALNGNFKGKKVLITGGSSGKPSLFS